MQTARIVDNTSRLAGKDAEAAALRQREELAHAQMLAERDARAAQAEEIRQQTEGELQARRARIRATFGGGGN